ncbi:hypothetical protein C2G38_540578 [Gigaspora rosea]|uniref:TLDc domain-containing protein n=1 Tax=Gigaspora rosea TaxID=44941 RepID=A0A397VRD0_9GLOM|nr:hypothetical protein C2G38_540578 [Gigaspora rosea]
MLIAYEFLLDELAKHLEALLIESNTHWLKLNFTRIYQESFQNNKLKELQQWCNSIIVKYPDIVFESDKFASIQENALVSLIKRDDLQMEEIKIWNYIIKWGIAQNPGLSSNPDDWSNEEFLALKSALKNCLPLIRYFQISGENISEFIMPYHQILEKNLWKDLINRSMAPNKPITSIILPPRVILTSELPHRSDIPFSNIIKEEHAAEIASWIDKNANAYSISNNPYDFKLLLRGSRDGFNSATFWNLCDNQKNLIVVIKVKGTDEILGGYNPVSWDKTLHGCYTVCNESFIFSLKNGTVSNSILSHVVIPKDAIYNDISNGPSFGSLYLGGRGSDFDQNRGCHGYDHPHSPQHHRYEKRIRNMDTYSCEGNSVSFFSADEYEIFQIHKKKQYNK